MNKKKEMKRDLTAKELFLVALICIIAGYFLQYVVAFLGALIQILGYVLLPFAIARTVSRNK